MLLFHLLKAPSTTRWLLFWVSLLEAWIGLASPQPRRAPETVPTPAGLAHRTRIVARYSIQPREGDRGARLGKLGLRELKRFSRMTNLVVLDEELPVDPQSQTTPEQRRKRLLSRIQQLQETGLFDYVEPDYLHVADAVPNDSAFANGTLWGLRNQGQSGGLSGADIDAVRAWDITTGSTDVIVAVIDTGIRYTHQDLSARMWQNPGESGALASDGIDNDGNGYVDDVYGINAVTGSGNPMDDNGHGTHCAGTIGAAANGSGPHVGVAWNVRLMGLKFMDAGGSGFTSDAIECINFAVAKGARVLSCSWGGGGYETSLKDAITRARNQGVLFVAAAGNESANSDVIPHYPSGYDVDNVISVAALDRSDNMAGFSNYGSRNVDLGAPGVDIYSTYHTANDAYATSSGTSMATPHVAGVAALVISRFPGISIFDLRQRLLATTVPVASLNGRSATGGRVNAYNALTASPDGTLEVSVSSSGSLIAGQSVTLVAQVTDLTAIGNATVTGSATGLPSMTFRNDGVSPDTTANDHLYCASFTVPSDRDQLVLTVQASAPSKTTQTVVTSFSIARPAANDNFSAATDLAGNVIQATGNNQVATKEPGEPNHAANNVGGKSVWWKWTAPSAGTATINTRGSTFDTILGIYTGTAVNRLTLVANNDDETYPNVITSRVQFTAIGGTTYRIAVDGYNNGSGADSGSITLNITAPPANDLFANRTAVAGGSWQQAGSNLYATKETAEPNHANNAGGQSVWWTWTAPANGPVVLHTSGSAFDTLLAVYTGSAANSLTMVASNDDSASGTTSWLSFTASAGATYQIAVDGKNTGGSVANGSITLSLSQSSSPVLTPVSNITTDEGQLLDLTLTATDADTATQDLTFSLVSGPSGMSVTGAGRLTWLPSEAQGPGSYSVTVAVSDGVSSATGSFIVTVREVNASPALTAINNQTIEEGSTLSLTLSASDADLPAQTLTYSLTSGPTGMTVTGAGALTWTPTEAQGPGSYTVTVTVSDLVTSASRFFTVTVNEVNAAPTLATIPNQTLDEGQTLALTLSASDTDLPAQTLTYSLTSGPTGMTVTGAGALTWTPTEAQGPGSYTVTVTVS
ncbi:MAG: S8 family serine peptidase, partial [Verrucomicrobiota bacterium]